MATTTIYPSGWTYIANTNKTADYSGVSEPKTCARFVAMTRGSDAQWAASNVSQNGLMYGTILRFNRPNALKYSKITAATLTISFDGLYNSEHEVDDYYGFASYTTELALSDVNWNSFRSGGVLGEWTTGGNGNFILTPSTKTISITSLFNGDLSRTVFDVVVALGVAASNASVWLNPSSCYLTVTYETAAQPAPTPLYPKDQTLIESDSTLFAWQFNSETAAVQTAAELQYKEASAQTYTTVNLTQSGYSYTLNQTLPAGSYQWRVKVTNDAGETSTYSEVANFNIVGKPAVPIINEPANKALTEITWNTSSQQSCEIVLSDQSGKELVHETLATAETSYKPNMFLKGQYLVKVRVMNDSLMWSEWAQKGFTISAAGPAAATMSIIAGAGIPAVRIGYTLPADVSAALMRRQNGETKIIAQLAPELPEYIDDTVSAGTAYEYFIRTYVNGYTDTAPATASVQFDGAIFQIGDEYLNLKASDEQFLPHSEEISAPYALNEYSGRSYYVIERGETINVIITRRFYVAQEQKATLDRMSLMESVFYRDSKENAFRAAILKTTYDAHMGDGYLATINIVRLNEEEVAVNV